MYGLKFNEIKTDEGQIVRPVGYPSSFWPQGTEYEEAKTAIRAWFSSLNLRCFYSKLVGNVFEEYMCFDTLTDAETFKTAQNQISAIILANMTTADNDPATDTIITNALAYMRLRNKVNIDNFGLYVRNYDTTIYNLDDVDLTGFTRYEVNS